MTGPPCEVHRDFAGRGGNAGVETQTGRVLRIGITLPGGEIELERVGSMRHCKLPGPMLSF